jgi:hypothetical protein
VDVNKFMAEMLEQSRTQTALLQTISEQLERQLTLMDDANPEQTDPDLAADLQEQSAPVENQSYKDDVAHYGSEAAMNGKAEPVVEAEKVPEAEKMAPPAETKKVEKITGDTIRSTLREVQQRAGRDAAIELLKKFGASNVSSLDEAKFADFIAAAAEIN